MRLLLLVLAALVAAGCSGDGDRRAERPPGASATATPAPTWPVAYLVPREALRTLPRGAGLDAIERQGEVIAESKWEEYPGVVALTWLDERGVAFSTPRDLRAVVNRQEVSVLVIADEHRRYARTLDRLRPTARALRRYNAEFSQDDYAAAGDAMLDWLRVYRLALAKVDARHVVVIPLFD